MDGRLAAVKVQYNDVSRLFKSKNYYIGRAESARFFASPFDNG